MPKVWQIKRELRRVGMQLGALPWIAVAPIARRIYDRYKADRLRITPGAAARTDELAILLIYQPKGLLESTLHTLDHFQAHGISTLVVSNAPLSPDDKLRLAAKAWKIIERPNFGYDFGGYRDAILHLLSDSARPDRLFVLNDSVWFPLQRDSNLLDEARASKADLFGFVLNDRMRGKNRAHIQSYFFSFSSRLVASRDFEDHWRQLFLTNNKNLVVRRCEIPMTEAFQRRGYSVAARHTYSDAAHALKTLDNVALRRVLEYQTTIDTRNAPLLRRHLKAQTLDASWRARVDADISVGRLDKYFLIAHPSVLIQQLDAPLLKKDRQEVYRLQRAEVFDCNLDTHFAPVVRRELRAWDQADRR